MKPEEPCRIAPAEPQQVDGKSTDRAGNLTPAWYRRTRCHVIDKHDQPVRLEQPAHVREGGRKVRHVMQRRRAEDQIESFRIVDAAEILHSVLDVRPRSLASGDLDQWLADVDADDPLEAFR